MFHVPENASTVAATRAGVMSYGRAVARYGEGFVRAELDGRRWQQPVHGVVVDHNGPLGDEQRTWVALLAAPPGALLHGLSAAIHDGFKGFEPDHLSIVIPGSSRNPRPQRWRELPSEWGVAVRWSTKLGPADTWPTADPPRTRVPRSIVDAASERVAERRARVIVLAAVQQRITWPAELWDALSRRGRCRNRAIIAESIIDATGGMDSLPERDFDLIRRGRGLPDPHRQAILRRPDGRYYLDADWKTWGVRSEIHGIPHSEVANWDRDLERQNEVTIRGGGLLIFSSYAIRHLATNVGDQLERMFRTRGWPHSP
jgi:hypothetical protein